MEHKSNIQQLLFLQVLAFGIANLTTALSSKSLLPNTLINSNFMSPQVATYSFFSKSIEGWNCTYLCQIDNCNYFNQYFINRNQLFANCNDQLIDLNSNAFDETVSQLVYLKAGLYRFGFNYYISDYLAYLKTLHVQLNQIEVFKLNPNIIRQFSINNVEIDVIIGEGITNVSFFDTGYSLDSDGFKINNVSLRMYYDPITTAFINTTMNNSVLNFICSVPGYRVIFGQLMNFFVNLDRFQLYSYHNRTYSHQWTIFLNSVYNLKQLQGNFLQNFMGSIGSQAQQLISGLSYKQDSDYQSQILQQQLNIDSIVQIDNKFYGCSLPLSCLQVLLFYVLFRLLFHYPVSLFFRSYYFVVPMIALIMTEGNVQHITFFICGQLITLFSACFTHKIVNSLLVFYFFLIVSLIFSLQLWLLYSLKRYWNIVIQGYRSMFYGALSCILSKGLFCMLLGVAHRLLMGNPYQLLVLLMLQIAWIVVRCVLLALNVYQCKIFVWLEILSGIVRILLILSFYLYQTMKIQIQALLNSSCDIILIILTILISLAYLLMNVLFILRYTWKTISKIVDYFDRQQTNEMISNIQIGKRRLCTEMAINKGEIMNENTSPLKKGKVQKSLHNIFNYTITTKQISKTTKKIK